MSKKKRKKKNEVNEGIELVFSCSALMIRLIAGFVSLIFMILTFVLLYVQALYAIDIAVLVALAGLFSYLSGYLALYFKGDAPQESEHMQDTLDEDKRKNNWQDDEFED